MPLHHDLLDVFQNVADYLGLSYREGFQASGQIVGELDGFHVLASYSDHDGRLTIFTDVLIGMPEGLTVRYAPKRLVKRTRKTVLTGDPEWDANYRTTAFDIQHAAAWLTPARRQALAERRNCTVRRGSLRCFLPKSITRKLRRNPSQLDANLIRELVESTVDLAKILDEN